MGRIGVLQNNKYSLTAVMTDGKNLLFDTDSEAIIDEMKNSLMCRGTWIEFPPVGKDKTTINTDQIVRIVDSRDENAD